MKRTVLQSEHIAKTELGDFCKSVGRYCRVVRRANVHWRILDRKPCRASGPKGGGWHFGGNGRKNL